MRFKEIADTLARNIPRLEDVNPTSVNGGYRVYNLRGFRQAIEEVSELELFNELTTPLKDTWLFETFEDEKSITSNTFDQIRTHYYQLTNAMKRVHSALSSVEFAAENTIAIRLPNIKDFDNLISVSNDLKRAIALPIADAEIGGSITIKAVDNGSIWFYIALGTSTAFSLVAAIAWASAVIFKKWQEALVNREYLKNLKIQNEAYQNVVDAQQTAIDLLTLEEVNRIQSEFFSTPDPERAERLKLSVTTFTELVQKGMQVEPSILHSEQSSNLFPDFRSLPLTASTTQQIADGTSD